MVLDRKLQYRILVTLQDVYPDSLLVSALPDYSIDKVFMGNLFYLQEHGLIEGGDIRQPGQCRSMVDAQITKDGLDFLADDGGTAGILGLHAVKIESRDITGSIEAGLNRAELTEPERSELLEEIAHMQTEQLKRLILGFVELGASDKVLLSSLLPK